MLEYARDAGITWLVGFAPQLEIYIAVPTGIFLGLDWPSAIFWAVFGNYLPVPLITWIFEVTRKKGQGDKWLLKFEKWLTRFNSKRFARMVQRRPQWFIILVTPLIGVWPLAVTANLLGIERRHILLYSFISVVTFALLTALAVHKGYEWIQ